MITHYIILSSSYSKGKRIALHFADENLDRKKIMKYLDDIKQHCGDDVSISSHVITTEDKTFDSVCKLDKFFKDVCVVKTIKEFISLILQDRKLRGIDIAKYILSIQPCNHLTLQKLTYLCYADYLCKTNKKLFDDKILAYTYGPVIQSIYDKFRGRGRAKLSGDELDRKEGVYKPDTRLSARSRIIFADGGHEKLLSIDSTLKKYGDIDSWRLVEITHREGSPWQRTRQSSIIKDSDILNYHCVESK